MLILILFLSISSTESFSIIDALSQSVKIIENIGLIPSYNATRDVSYLLFTKNNPTDPQTLTIDDTNSLNISNYNVSCPTRFLVHGWRYDYKLFLDTKDAYLSESCFNVIAVNWIKGAGTLNYPVARLRVTETGQFLCRFIQFLVTAGGANLSNIYLIGFSLGAHVVGIAGRCLEGKVAVIVGLDPGGPGFVFIFIATEDTLKPSDAVYVITIITNGVFFGTLKPLGQANFYVNRGIVQPKCQFSLGCSHNASVTLFQNSILDPIYGTQSGNLGDVFSNSCRGMKAQMGGEPVQIGAEGYFCVTTDKYQGVQTSSI